MHREGVFSQLVANWPGRVGVFLFSISVLISLYVLVTFPLDFGARHWSNPARWADNPRSAPPTWTNLFRDTDKPRHLVLRAVEPSEMVEEGNVQIHRYEFPFTFRADVPPTSLSFSWSDIAFNDRPPMARVFLLRPDGAEVSLHRHVLRGPREGETAPYARLTREPLRVVLTEEPGVAENAGDMLEHEYGIRLPPIQLRTQTEAVLFGVPGDDGLDVLRGEYTLVVDVFAFDEADTSGTVQVVVGGSVFGVMGTDELGRDLVQGLLFGLPIALLIGIAVSTISTVIGTTLGLTSGYVGGSTDIFIQRWADAVSNIPVLPLLIFLVFALGSHLWLIMAILVAFSWPGLTIVVRSMVLGLRSSQEVEAARAISCSTPRILFRHVFPHLAPYIFAQLIFFAPAAILAEAGLSFLGLGDPSLPTWGQILSDGFRTGAVFLGYWWWIVPPGLLIVVVALTFMFLALGLEPVVNPKLRKA